MIACRIHLYGCALPHRISWQPLRRAYRVTTGILFSISNVHAEFTMIQAFPAQFATAETNFILSSHLSSLRQQAQTDLAAGVHITFIFTDKQQNNKCDIYLLAVMHKHDR